MIQPILDACCGGKMFYFDKNDPRVRVNGDSIVCAEKGRCLVMQNELTFADLLTIYRNIPYKEGW